MDATNVQFDRCESNCQLLNVMYHLSRRNRTFPWFRYSQRRSTYSCARRWFQMQPYHCGGVCLYVGGCSVKLRCRKWTCLLRMQSKTCVHFVCSIVSGQSSKFDHRLWFDSLQRNMMSSVQVIEHLSVDHLPDEEKTRHVVRVGFSTDDSGMQLGQYIVLTTLPFSRKHKTL